MVNAVLSPLSSMMLQLLYGSHTVPNSARPIEEKKNKIPPFLTHRQAIAQRIHLQINALT